MAIALSERRGYYGSDDELTTFLHQNGARIIHERDGGLIECYVPMDLIDHEEVAVRGEWAQSLALQMREYSDIHGGTGQKQTIGLGMILGESKLKIVDGFHRDAALHINGAPEVYASAQQTDWDGLYDDRIILAKDHTQVRFTRVVEWMRECWQYSGYPDQMSIVQALLQYRFQTSGKKLDINPEMVKATSEWVARKEAKWGIAAMTMRNYLQIAEHVDPTLVHTTREKTSSHVLEAPTQAIVQLFCDILPDNYDLQNLVMETAMARNLKGPEVRTICNAVKDKTFGEAEHTIKETDWSNLEVDYEETTQRARRRAHDPRYKGADVLYKAAQDVRAANERTDIIFEKEEEVNPEMMGMIKEARERAQQLILELGGLTSKLTTMIGDSGIEPSPEQEKVAGSLRPKEIPKGIVGVLHYLMGTTDTMPETFSTNDLHRAWGLVNNTPIKPKDWQSRFLSLQRSIVDSARMEKRLISSL
jgi:hypothetical protein